jgi:hypothetical protein
MTRYDDARHDDRHDPDDAQEEARPQAETDPEDIRRRGEQPTPTPDEDVPESFSGNTDRARDR